MSTVKFSALLKSAGLRGREATWGSVTTGAEGGSGPVGPGASGLLLGSL